MNHRLLRVSCLLTLLSCVAASAPRLREDQLYIIGGRPKLVVPYVISPGYIAQPGKKWITYADTPEPESAESWINAIAPVIEEAVEYFKDTNIHFRRYSYD